MFGFFKRKKAEGTGEAAPVADEHAAGPEAGEAAQDAAEVAARVEAEVKQKAEAETEAAAQAEAEAKAQETAARAAAEAAAQEAAAKAKAEAEAEAEAAARAKAELQAQAAAAQARSEELAARSAAANQEAEGGAEEPVAELSVQPAFAPVLQPVPEHEPEPAAPAAVDRKSSWLSRLKTGLSRTGQSIGGLFVGVKVDEALFEELETALIMADAGMEATEKLLTALRAKVRKERIEDAGKVKAALRDILAEHLAPLEKKFKMGYASPIVVMIAGVNGAGKTTSIGKLAYAFQSQGEKVLLAAGDTFRAAAREQLIVWGERNNVSVIAQEGGDPAAVAFDAVNAGRARGAGIVMVDTAGRLPTQLHLMEELKKIRRVIGKADNEAPHEVLLVVDGNTGQNALAQIRAFDAAITLTGLVVTKLDGTAKGGTLAAVAAGSQGVRPIPVYWIGVGEGMEDLQPFVAREFASAMVGD
ncbi:signal recognition particle-docking protein FtsY [Eoetvoesiella caeni]